MAKHKEPHVAKHTDVLKVIEQGQRTGMVALQSHLWACQTARPFSNRWSPEPGAHYNATECKYVRSWGMLQKQAGVGPVPAPQPPAEPDRRQLFLSWGAERGILMAFQGPSPVAGLLEGWRKPELPQAAAYPAPSDKCGTGRSAGRALPHEPPQNRRRAVLGSNADYEEQHRNMIFTARAGMLKQVFLFLFMSWGLGFVLCASCSQRPLWTACLATWPGLRVYHHSLETDHAVPWVPHLSAENSNEPSKTEGHGLLSGCPDKRSYCLGSDTDLEMRESSHLYKRVGQERMNKAFLLPYIFAQGRELVCNQGTATWGWGSSRLRAVAFTWPKARGQGRSQQQGMWWRHPLSESSVSEQSSPRGSLQVGSRAPLGGHSWSQAAPGTARPEELARCSGCCTLLDWGGKAKKNAI